MVTVNATDPATTLPNLLARVRRGESVVLVEDGEPIAHLEPATEDLVAWWRGTYAPDLPRTPAPGIVLPVVVVERRLPEVNTSWYRPHDDDE